MLETRPVSSANSPRIAFSSAVVGLTPVAACTFAALKAVFAGSTLVRPNASVGTRFEFFSHTLYIDQEAPAVMLWLPLRYVSVLSNDRSVASRDCGAGPGAGPVRPDVNPGRPNTKPFMLATLPSNMPTFSSSKNLTGAPL